MNAAKLVETYLDTWNETDPNARRSAVASVWAEDAQYVDPLADVSGHDQISELIGGVQQQAPGHVFRLLDDRVDSHHNVVRFSWELVPASGGDPSRSASTSPSPRRTGASVAWSASSTSSPAPELGHSEPGATQLCVRLGLASSRPRRRTVSRRDQRRGRFGKVGSFAREPRVPRRMSCGTSIGYMPSSVPAIYYQRQLLFS